MLYRLFIATEAGEQRLTNVTTESTKELLTLIQCSSMRHDVIQVVLYEQLAERDGIRPLARVGSFASYYNGQGYSDLLEILVARGRGRDLHDELNRLHKEQARRTA